MLLPEPAATTHPVSSLSSADDHQAPTSSPHHSNPPTRRLLEGRHPTAKATRRGDANKHCMGPAAPADQPPTHLHLWWETRYGKPPLPQPAVPNRGGTRRVGQPRGDKVTNGALWAPGRGAMPCVSQAASAVVRSASSSPNACNRERNQDLRRIAAWRTSTGSVGQSIAVGDGAAATLGRRGHQRDDRRTVRLRRSSPTRAGTRTPPATGEQRTTRRPVRRRRR